MNHLQNHPKEAQALIPDLLPDLVPAAIIAERFREVTIENLRRMTAARRGTPTESTMALPLNHHQEDRNTDPGTGKGLLLGTEEELPQDLGTTMTQDLGTMILGSTQVEKGVRWNTLGEDTLYTDRMIITEKEVPTPRTDRHQEGDHLPGQKPEDRHRDRGNQDLKADMETLHQGMTIGQVLTGPDH